MTLEIDGQSYAQLEAAVRTRLSEGVRPVAGGISQVAANLMHQGVLQEAEWVQAESGLASLTPGYRQVARLAASGRNNQQIVETLVALPETMKTHVRHALERLGLQGRRELQLLLAANGRLSVEVEEGQPGDVRRRI